MYKNYSGPFFLFFFSSLTIRIYSVGIKLLVWYKSPMCKLGWLFVDWSSSNRNINFLIPESLDVTARCFTGWRDKYVHTLEKFPSFSSSFGPPFFILKYLK